MDRILIEDELNEEKDQQKEVFLESIEINEDEINSIFIDVLHKRENLEVMFLESIDETDEEKYKEFIDHFIIDKAQYCSTKEELEKLIEKYCISHKTFYSEIAEGFSALVIKKFLNANPTHALISLENTVIDTHTGVDGVLYDEEEEKMFFVEAKFYEKLKDAPGEILKSLKSINKYESFKNKGKIHIAKILDKTNYDVRVKDAVTLDITFIGFVLHGEKNKMNKRRYAKEIEKYVSKAFELDDDQELEYKFILFYLYINKKQQLIFDIIKESKRKLEE